MREFRVGVPVAVMKAVRRLGGSGVAVALVCFVSLALLVISETAYYQAIKSLDQLDGMGATRLANVHLSAAITEAETAQRGYLLTSRPDYLNGYRTATARVRTLLAELGRSYTGDAGQTGTLAELRSHVQSKLSELETSIELHATGRADAAVQLMFNDIGKTRMEDIRATSAKLVEREARRIDDERKRVYDTLMLSRIGVGTMTALSVVAVLLYLRQTVALVRQQHEQRTAIQAERDQLEQQVRERTRQLTELARHLQTAREDERSRLARDLHDELGALLTAAKLDAARLKSRLPHISEEGAARLAHLNETLNSGIALKRRIIEDLRPSSLANLGLVAALEILAREFAERSGVRVRVEVEPVELSPSCELTVYRLVQEATTNIAKYAQAREVVISLHPQGDRVEVSIADDGVGFDPQSRRTSAHGLLGMHYRVESEGGEMRLRSSPGAGTHISAVLPRRGATADEPAAAVAGEPHPPAG